VKVEFVDYEDHISTARITSQGGEVDEYMLVTPKVLKRMGESSKRYFYARVRNGNVSLAGYAPWQPW